MKKSILFFTLLWLSNFAINAQKKIWLDTDLLLGLNKNAPREVDDAIAMMMLLDHEKEIDLKGISTISEVKYGKKLAQSILKTYFPKLKIPVYEGSNICTDIGVETEASLVLAKELSKNKLTILAIGPATNIATVLKNHPNLVGQIEEIVFCAGRTANLPFTLGLEYETVSDYNFDRSNEAFQIVFESKVPVVLSGFEAGRSILLGETDFEFLKLSQNPTNRWMHKHLKDWAALNFKLFGIKGFVPWDCTSIGYVLYPQFFTINKNTPIGIVNKKTDATVPKGLPAFKNYLEITAPENSPWRCSFVSQTKLGFEELILESFKKVTNR
jgi:inosine-uridine nucleoside N-ribohydrolase